MKNSLTPVVAVATFGLLLWNFHDVNLGIYGLLAVPTVLTAYIIVTSIKSLITK